MTGRVFLALLLPLLAVSTSDPRLVAPLDCTELYNTGHKTSGEYTIYPTYPTPVQVYCEMGYSDGQQVPGKWTVFQRRMDGSVHFYRPWEAYKNGFGNTEGEYWLGLENLYQLTSKKKYELRVDMQDFEGGKAYAQYSSFSVEAEYNGYKLHVSGFTDGGAGDSLAIHNGHKFSTFDKDPEGTGCAAKSLGGFWYSNCHNANPNGMYVWGFYKFEIRYGIGNFWSHWKGHDYGLKFISMKIRPVSEQIVSKECP